MTAVFADASFYIAVLNRRDSLHASARKFADAYTGRVITTEFVLLEVANFLSSAHSRAEFVALMSAIGVDPQVEIVESSTTLWQQGLSLYSGRRDKDWSLTDCISFAVMQQRGISDALSADHHFEQAGFKTLVA